MSLRTFFRTGAWYQDTQKALESDIEATEIVSNADPYDPVIVSGGGGVETITAGTNITLGGTATDPIINASGGGSETLDEVLANGSTLTEDRDIDLAGFILSIDGVPIGGANFYTNDGTITSHRTIDLDDHLLKVTNGVGGFEYIYTSPGGDSKLNNTDGNNTVRIESAGGDGFFLLLAQSISESGLVHINGNAIEKKITYTADIHIFNGKINLPADAANSIIGTSDAMVAGTVIVNTTAVTAISKIFLSHAAPIGTLGWLSPGTIVPGVSFVINSTGATDLSTVNWFIIN